jgi:hypothetical protein
MKKYVFVILCLLAFGMIFESPLQLMKTLSTSEINYELTGANPIIGESAIKGVDMAVKRLMKLRLVVNGKSYKFAYKLWITVSTPMNPL